MNNDQKIGFYLVSMYPMYVPCSAIQDKVHGIPLFNFHHKYFKTSEKICFNGMVCNENKQPIEFP